MIYDNNSTARHHKEQTAVKLKASILVLGGGLAGVQIVRELEKVLPSEDAFIRLVCPDKLVLVTPMLHEVASSDVDLSTIVIPIDRMMKRSQFVEAVVEKIDLDQKAVTIADGLTGRRRVLTCDHLILALGTVTDFQGIDNLDHYALTIKSLDDAVRLRARLVANVKEASTTKDSSLRERLLTLVVTGGGFSGVETVAGLDDLVRSLIRPYPNLDPGMVRVLLIHSDDNILPALSSELGLYAAKKLRKRGIQLLLNRRVKAITADAVTLDDETIISTRFVVWGAATTASPLIAGLPIANRDGRIAVTRMLEAIGHPGVWTLGDAALVSNMETGTRLSTMRNPHRQARILALNVAASLHGSPLVEFELRHMENEEPFAGSDLVAKLLTWHFSGAPAIWVWRAIYLGETPYWEMRFRVALQWIQHFLRVGKRRSLLD
jgi:NADH:ubiquinone reductase (H+-translocating)